MLKIFLLLSCTFHETAPRVLHLGALVIVIIAIARLTTSYSWSDTSAISLLLFVQDSLAMYADV